MKLFVVLCLASVALASPQGYGYSGYSAPTVVSERTYTIQPQVQGGSFGGASYGGASFGGASYGGASYGASSGRSYGRSLGFSAATPVQVEQRSYQLQASSAAPAYQAQASGYYGGGASLNGAAEQGGSYVVNFGVNSGRSLNLAGLSGGYASGYSGYSAAVPMARAYSGEAAHSAAAEHIDLSAHSQGETKIFKHVYAFSGPEEPAQRAKVVVKAPVSNSKHFKLVFIKAPTSGAIVDSDITLPAQEEEKTQIYVLSKQQHHQPTIRVHTAQAAKHNKPEVLFVKYRNDAEAQAIASGAISGQASGIPAGGQIVSDGSVSVGGSGNYGGYSGYSGASFGSGAGLMGVASGRSLYLSNGANSGSGLVSYKYGSGSGIGSSSGFGSGARFGPSSGFGSGARFGSSSGFGSGAGFGSSASFGSGAGFGSGFGSGTGFGSRSVYGSRSTYSRSF